MNLSINIQKMRDRNKDGVEKGEKYRGMRETEKVLPWRERNLVSRICTISPL